MDILVIEKSEVCRFILDQCLTSLGHVLHDAGKAEAALPFMLSHPVDCVFMDIDFGRERAVEAIQAIRMEHQGEWFPIVALSSGNDDEAFAGAILAGADALLPKPLSRHRILMQLIALERMTLARQTLQTNQDLVAANRALLELSMFDEITALANRRYFEKTLNREKKLAKRERHPLTLLICEIGNLSGPGLAEEDEARNRQLTAIAAAIECIPSRPTDFVCCYSGDLFAVILPNTDEKGGRHIAERIQASVKPVLADWPKTPLTFRIGSATDNSQYQTIDDLINAALAALKNGE